MVSELEQIQQFYKNYDISLSTEWLESCIEWCKDGNLPPNYTIKDLQKMVWEQWLLLDLRDVEIPSLPRNLSTQKQYTLTGSYCLQMMQVIDISKPKLWQLQRIRNKVARNTEVERDFGKRVLQLTLTDGVQEVEAMEFKPIPCLNINLLPGTKIRINGPIKIRNGRLMLTQENIKCLGGSVDEIRVKYAAENVLARALKLEENPNPFTIDEKHLEVIEDNQTQSINNTIYQNYNSAPNQNRNQNVPPQPAYNPSTSQRVNAQNNSINQIRNQIIPPEYEVDDELLHELEDDFEEDSIRKTVGNVKTVKNVSQIKNQIIPPEYEVDDDLLRELEADFEENSIRNTIGRLKTPCKTTKSAQNNPKPIKSDQTRICSSPDLFDEMEVDENLLNEHLNQIDADHITSDIKSSMEGSSKTSMKKLGTGDNKKTDLLQDFSISSSNINKPDQSDEVVVVEDDSFEDIDIDSHLDNIDDEMANLPSSTQVRNDIKERIRSPELKIRKLGPSSTFKKTESKKLTQPTLNFLLSRKDSTIDRENPYSIFKNSSQKSTSSVGPIKMSPEFESKQLSGGLKNVTSSPVGNILTIEKLKKMMPNIGKGKFKIKAKFKVVAEKLRHTEDSYKLVIVVEDSTGELSVQVHSDVVAGIVGMGPEELGKLRVLALQQDEEVKRQIVNVLSKLHQRCLSLDNILEIQVIRGETYPIVVNII